MNATLEDIAGSDGTYQTAPRKLSAWGRTFPSLSFYGRFMSIILRGAAQAKQNRYPTSQWYRSSLDVLLALEQVGVSFDISGVTHLKRLQSPCVIVANHMSVLETVVLPRLILPNLDVTCAGESNKSRTSLGQPPQGTDAPSNFFLGSRCCPSHIQMY